MKHLLAVDWGTSSLRGAWLDADGRVLEERASARGVQSVAPGGFAAVFDEHFGAWARTPDTLCLVSGMAGSQQGWLHAPYCECPAAFDDVACQVRWIGPRRIAIAPGLRCEHDGTPDVMRGEEVQVFGALQLLGMSDALLVLPGTHSKWVRVRAGVVETFATFMTGEFYALLRQHSILARSLPPTDAESDDAAFDEGVAKALRSEGLLHTAFSVRTLALFERMPIASLASYLSGLVIGEELRCRPPGADGSVVLVGNASLTRRYARAFDQCKVVVLCVGPEATWRGLWALARRLEQR
jgi:2-dehydro-3-deoxygalactonokinase